MLKNFIRLGVVELVMAKNMSKQKFEVKVKMIVQTTLRSQKGDDSP